MVKKTEEKKFSLLDTIVDALHDRKANEVTSVNLKKITTRVCDYFVICHADSTVQVQAIADGVYKRVKKDFSQSPHSFEGYENANWILLDYYDVIVHIFQTPYRNFYQLEKLWADGKVQVHEPEMIEKPKRIAKKPVEKTVKKKSVIK